MADLLYCGAPPVGPDKTTALLEGSFNAVWAPPMGMNTPIEEGDRLWLVWREARADAATLLGTGVVLPTPAGSVMWTNRTAPGIRQAAIALGYGGPTNMAFLRLGHVRICRPFRVVEHLKNLSTGLSPATTEQLNALLAASAV